MVRSSSTRLLDVSDVLVINNRPSALARWGIDYESVHERHPQLVMLHVSGYGRGGPKSDSPGFGTLAEAMSGFAHLTGQPDGPPTLPPFMLADGVAALAATYAVMMALYHRDVHGGRRSAGRRQPHRTVGPADRVLHPRLRPAGRRRRRVGNRFDAVPPETSTRPPTESGWPSRAHPPTSPRGSTGRSTGPTSRRIPTTSIPSPVSSGLGGRRVGGRLDQPSHPGRGDGRLRGRRRSPPHPSTTPNSCSADEHLRARGTFVEVDDPDLGPMTVQAPVAVLTETPDGSTISADTSGPTTTRSSVICSGSTPTAWPPSGRLG